MLEEEEIHWLVRPDGRVDLKWLVDSDNQPTHRMCCICFDYTLLDQLYMDAEGSRWDVCQSCGEMEHEVGGP